MESGAGVSLSRRGFSSLAQIPSDVVERVERDHGARGGYVLSLAHNRLTRIDDMYIFRHVVELDLSGNMLRSLDGLEALTWLERLDVSQNALTTLDAVAAMPQLRALHVAENDLVQLDAVAALHSLAVLDASSNNVAAWPQLSHIITLETVDLSRNLLEAPPLSVVRRLFPPELRHLALSRNQLHELCGIACLGRRLQRLEALRLDGNPAVQRVTRDGGSLGFLVNLFPRVEVSSLVTGGPASKAITQQQREDFIVPTSMFCLLRWIIMLLLLAASAWNVFLALLQLSPNDLANNLMNTTTLDGGEFWQFADCAKEIQMSGVVGLGAVSFVLALEVVEIVLQLITLNDLLRSGERLPLVYATRTLYLEELDAIQELPSLSRLRQLRILVLESMESLPLLPTLDDVSSTLSVLWIQRSSICCSGYLADGIPDLDAMPCAYRCAEPGFCFDKSDPTTSAPLSFLPSASTQRILQPFISNLSVCDPAKPIQFHREIIDWECNGVMYRQCSTGMCFSDGTQVVQCTSDLASQQLRRAMIQAGFECDVVEETWLGCR
ncbi:hypothetical protein ATCC90586_007161 [Pythium insidiosum]|nr:hypothetical protein ATCC90586_007161 [Pythium insidiosum]